MPAAKQADINAAYPKLESQQVAIRYVREGLCHHVGESITRNSEPEYFNKLLVLMRCHPNFKRKFNKISILQFTDKIRQEAGDFNLQRNAKQLLNSL